MHPFAATRRCGDRLPYAGVVAGDLLRIDDGVAWVGERRMPAGAKVTVIDQVFDLPGSNPGGRALSYHRRGFALPFENGWTVSVAWQSSERFDSEPPPFPEETPAANVTVSDRDGRCVVWDDDGTALGKSLDHTGIRYATGAHELLRLIDQVAEWPTHYLPIMDRV